MSAARVGGPFDDTLKTLDASEAVKNHLHKVVVEPLTSARRRRSSPGSRRSIGYDEATLFKRIQGIRGPLERDVNDLRASVR